MMRNRRFFGSRRWRRVRLGAALAWFTLSAAMCNAEVPDWMRTAARENLPMPADSGDAVVLLDERQTFVSGDGQIKTLNRRVVRILDAQGVKKWGTAAVAFDSETKLRYLKAWSISASGKEYEGKDKDRTETALSEEVLYADTKYAYIRLPAVEAGTVVGYEYEQNRRPAILQDVWEPQESISVHRARYSLTLPSGWTYRAIWMNGEPRQPTPTAQNLFIWELENVPAIKHEPTAPDLHAVFTRVGLTFVPPTPQVGHSFASWTDVALWFGQISASSMRSSPELQAKVQQLVPPSNAADDKIRTFSVFVQKEVRYVAIEIGIGGYQPHAASSTLSNKYGDCKDKATLLTVMLREAGIQSYPVLVHSSRGLTRPEFPSPYQFNHMIVAIGVAANSQYESAPAAADEGALGRLLFFDPTAETYPVGILHDALQGSQGLILAGDQTRMVTLPMASAEASKLQLASDLKLESDGTVAGTVTLTYTGSWAARMRNELAEMNRREKGKKLEELLVGMQGTPTVTRSFITDENDISKPLVLRYELRSSGYAETAGRLMLLRLGVLGPMADSQSIAKAVNTETRRLPIELVQTGVYSEVNTIGLPNGFEVDELPDTLNLKGPAISYSSHAETAGKTLKYERRCEITSLLVPVADVEKLKTIYGGIRADEQKSAVLKKVN
jgi:transglutaminase-like putative cysteine protease